MKFIAFLLVFLLSVNSYAARMSGQAGLGMVNSAIHLAADFDYQTKKSHSIGGFLYFGMEKDNIRKSFFITGADMKVFFGPKAWQVYLGPGVGLFNTENNANESATAFGTLLKVGTLARISNKFSAGLEWSVFMNWTSDKIGSNVVLGTAVVRMHF